MWDDQRSFGFLPVGGAGGAGTARMGSFWWSVWRGSLFSRTVHRSGGDTGGEPSCGGAGQEGRLKLTGVVCDGARQAKPEKLPEGDGFANGVGTTMEETNSVEPFDREGQGGEQPDEE